MADTYTNRLKKRLPAPGDIGWDGEWHDNEKIDDVVMGALLAGNKVVSGGAVTAGTGLEADITALAVLVGGVPYAAIAADTLTLDASETNWIYVSDAGVITVNTIPPVGDYVPLALVDTDATAVLRIADLRPTVRQPNPIVIFSTGQSNMPVDKTYSWTPAPNLKLWNFNRQASTVVGTAFLPIDPTKIGPSLAAANFIALENPDTPVYVININMDGMSLINWSASPVDYNFRQAIDGNVPVALAAIGASQIDHFIWAGCEGDVLINSTTIVADFENYLMAWLKTKTWFAGATTYVMAMSPWTEVVPGSGDYKYKRYNNALRQCVAANPSKRVWIDFDDFPVDLFVTDATSYTHVHFTPEGYFQSGMKLARTILAGACEPISRLDNAYGEYTPVFSSLVNCSGATNVWAHWRRTGNIIWVETLFTLTITTINVLTILDITVPVKAIAALAAAAGNTTTTYGDSGLLAKIAGSALLVRAYIGNPRTAGLTTVCARFSYKVAASDALPNVP